MRTQPHVADLDGAFAVVVPDWYSYYHTMDVYCGREKYDASLPRGADLYILCHDGKRAEEMLAQVVRYPFSAAQEIAIDRYPTYGGIARRLMAEGHAVACDTHGPDCDDKRLKALHPPPEGPVIDFEWMPGKKRYRMRCLFTGKDGSTSSQRIVLTSEPDWEEQIAKGYRRFSKRAAPTATSLVVLPHVAAALSRLDWHAAQRLARWRAEIEQTGIDGHQDVAPLLIAAGSIERPADLAHLELKGVRGSYLLSSRCTYHGGTTINDRLLDLKASLPETMVAGLVGLPASRIWGDDDLASLSIARNAKAKGIGFMLEGDVSPLPAPTPKALDEAAAQEALRTFEMPKNMQVDTTFLYLVSQLPASVRLHVYQTLLTKEDARIDISPWLSGASERIFLVRNHLVLQHVPGRYLPICDGVAL